MWRLWEVVTMPCDEPHRTCRCPTTFTVHAGVLLLVSPLSSVVSPGRYEVDLGDIP